MRYTNALLLHFTLRHYALCGGWCQRMVLRDPELHARNDDNDITLSPCSGQVVINHNSTKQLFESNETHHKMTETVSQSAAYSIVWMLGSMQRVPSPGLPSNICSICELNCDASVSPCPLSSLLQTYDKTQQMSNKQMKKVYVAHEFHRFHWHGTFYFVLNTESNQLHFNWDR